MERLTVICAWCSKVKQWGDPTRPVSHGICEACLKTLTEHRDVAIFTRQGHGTR